MKYNILNVRDRTKGSTYSERAPSIIIEANISTNKLKCTEVRAVFMEAQGMRDYIHLGQVNIEVSGFPERFGRFRAGFWEIERSLESRQCGIVYLCVSLIRPKAHIQKKRAWSHSDRTISAKTCRYFLKGKIIPFMVRVTKADVA